jgi:hypothetical protein
MASDSVDGVYTQGLRQLGYTGPIRPGAGRAMFELARKNPQRHHAVAMDAKQQQEIATRFPGVAKLKQR